MLSRRNLWWTGLSTGVGVLDGGNAAVSLVSLFKQQLCGHRSAGELTPSAIAGPPPPPHPVPRFRNL